MGEFPQEDFEALSIQGEGAFPQEVNGPLVQRSIFFGGFGGRCSQANRDFPRDFKIPLDQGGPPCPFQTSPRVPIGGFGGDRHKDQAGHRAAVRSVGKAPIILIHGQGGSADLGRWAMTKLRENLMAIAGYPRELIWAPSYLGRSTQFGGELDLQFPHAHNVGEIREFIDSVCEYLGVKAVDIIAHSLGCTLAYSALRGLKKQTGPFINSWSWDDQLKKWHRVGTFVALAGAFQGLRGNSGEWVPGGEFMNELLAEELADGEDETPFGEGEQQTPGLAPHNIRYLCGIAKGDFADGHSPDSDRSTSMLEGAKHEVFEFPGDEWAKHEAIIKDPRVVHRIKDLLNFVPPVPSVMMSVNKDSGHHDSLLTITIDVDPPEKIVSYVANRVTKEVSQGYLVGKVAETLQGTFMGGRTRLTLPTDGMWEVTYNVEGAVEAEKRTYWIGATEKIEVATDTDSSTPFEESSSVTATAPEGSKIYHSLSGGGRSKVAAPLGDALSTVVYGEGWSEGDVSSIDRNAVVYFIAIDDEGNASEIVSQSFGKSA